jgi:hypothetical protein
MVYWEGKRGVDSRKGRKQSEESLRKGESDTPPNWASLVVPAAVGTGPVLSTEAPEVFAILDCNLRLGTAGECARCTERRNCGCALRCPRHE